MHSNLLNTWLDQSRDHALILLNPEGRVTEWFPGAFNLLGYTREEALGQLLDFIFVPEDRARGEPAHERAVARRLGRCEDDRWHMRKDGSRLWVEGIVTGLFDAQHNLVGYGKVMRDRTDIRAHIDTLENRNKALAHADEERRLFFGTLAHEIRNFIGPLGNAAQLIEMQRKEDEPLFPVTLIKRQVAAMSSLVDDMLQLTLAGQGRALLNCSRVDLATVARQAVDTCSAQLRDKEVTVAITICDRIEIEADELKLQQILVNLLANACKFSPRQSVIQLRFSTEGSEAVIRVEDSGSGITRDLLPHIFEAFVQGSDGQSRRGSLGLGLALVKRYVDLHGGTVQVRSEGTGRGSEFIVRLPIAQKARDAVPGIADAPGQSAAA